MRRSQPLLALLALALASVAAAFFATSPSVHAQKEPSAETSAKTPLPNLQPNKDWLAHALASEKGVHSRAWSDPAAGCHLALFGLPLPPSAASDKILESLSSTLATSDYQLSASDLPLKPTRLDLEGFGVTGLATLFIPTGKIREARLLACYWSAREPSYCRSLCETADDAMRTHVSKDEVEVEVEVEVETQP